MSIVLGIETSCDECSASLVRFIPHQPMEVLSLSTFSQISLHAPFGGVVPELASRSHLETMNPILESCFEQAALPYTAVDAIAVTNRPGLVGSLLVGVGGAKAFAYAVEKPLIPVHHLEGHVNSIFLEQKTGSLAFSLTYPLLTAVISGGHTNLYVFQEPAWERKPGHLADCLVGYSLDDAAGEAFDKAAQLLQLGYPGGVAIETLAKKGDPHAFSLPRPFLSSNKDEKDSTYLHFSFSGLKTAFSLLVKKIKDPVMLETQKAHLSAAIQAAIVDVLFVKIERALEVYQCKSLAVVGGVASNQALREKLKQIEYKLDHPLCIPSPLYCTDNAAMIAAAGAFYYEQKSVLERDAFLSLTAYPLSLS